MNTRISTIILIIAIAIITPLTAAESDQKSVTTIAILPFHCRAGAKHKDLATAIALISGSVIQQSGRAAVVDREQVDKVFGEKAMAEAELTDKAELAKAGQTIGADFVVWGYYDIIDGELIIKSELIPSSKSDFGKLYQDVDRNFKQVRVEGPTTDSIVLIEKFAADLRDILPEPKIPSGEQKALFKPSEDKAIAVFSFAPSPIRRRTQALASALTDMIHMDMQEVLPLRLVERERIDAILQEKKLELAGLTYRSQARQVARLVGADFILTGSVIHYGESARLDMQLVDVATGAIITTVAKSGKYDDLLEMHRQLAVSIAERMGAGLQRLDWLRQRKTGRSVEAVTQATRARQIAYHGRGSLEERLKEAKILIKMALDLDSNDGQVVACAGLTEWKSENYDQAERYLRKAVQLDPGSSYCNLQLARFLLRIRKKPSLALPFVQQAVDTSPLYNRQSYEILAQCLIELQHFKKAEGYARKAMSIKGGSAKASRFIAQALEGQGKWSEAGTWYEREGDSIAIYKSGKKAFDNARAMYEKVGNKASAMRILEKKVANRHAYTREYVELAEYLSDRQPTRAAALCYWVAQFTKRPTYNDAVQLLKRMGRPLQPPLFTSSVFDIEKMRDLGVKIYLQPYEGFKFSKQLPYLKAYVEDVLGVPVEISETVRPLVAENYIRAVDKIRADDYFGRELDKICQDTESTTCVGLCSTPMTDVGSKRWLAWPVGLVSTYSNDPFDWKKPPPAHLIAPYTMACTQRLVVKYAALALKPTMKQRRDQCIGQLCALSPYIRIVEWQMDPMVCEECRRLLYIARKDWPGGAQERLPIQAGPTEPATGDIKSKVLLIALGMSAAEAKLSAVAQSITMATGLEVITKEDLVLPKIPRNKINWGELESLLEYKMSYASSENPPAAVCIITNDIVRSRDLGVYWTIWTPGDLGVPKEIKCPMIALTLVQHPSAQDLPERFLRTELISIEVDGKTETFAAPQYAKVLVGGLAIAARKDHQCWHYGCPSTVATFVGTARRCSYWLCPECRKAVAQYYQTSATNNSDKQQTPVVSK